MNRDARITLYGGALVSLATIAAGMATNGLITVMGWGFLLATLLLSCLCASLAPADPADAG